MGPPVASSPCARSRSAYAKWARRAPAILSKSLYLTKLTNFIALMILSIGAPSGPMPLWLSNLVEEFVQSLADTLQPENLRHRQIRIGDVPAFRRDLVLDEVILRSRTANARPTVPRGVDDVQIVGNLGHEVVNIGVPIAIKGRGKEQPCVVVEEHEAHIVESAD